MNVFRSLQEANLNCPTVITVGTFDGIHLGHLQVIKKLKKERKPSDCQDLLITFYPHPKIVLGKIKNKQVQLLTPLNEKLQLLEKLEISSVLVIPFTLKFSQTSYKDFVEKILVEKLHVRSMVIGYDHTFGKNREGHPEQLKRIAKDLNFTVQVVKPYYLDDQIVSSTNIRAHLSEGNIEKANVLLGRRYSITGTVIRGKNRGTELGFPTANLKVSDPHKLIPKNGVYGVDVLIEGSRYRGMMNIGHRPTFNFDLLTLETHIINFTGSIYGKYMEIEFKKFIREERKFNNKFDLKAQLDLDKKICENI
jgi:riboflavin kinase/FMN adenylyltransferase